MSNIKITDLPSGVANPSGVVPCDNPSATVTEKITLGSIRDLPHYHSDTYIKTSYQYGNTLEDDAAIYDLGASTIIKISSTDPYSIAGFNPIPLDDSDANLKLLSNVGSFNIEFSNNAAPAGQRIRCKNNTAFVLSPGSSIWTYYDHADLCWRLG